MKYILFIIDIHECFAGKYTNCKIHSKLYIWDLSGIPVFSVSSLSSFSANAEVLN